MKYHRTWLDVLDSVHKQYEYTGTHKNQYNQHINCSQPGLWEKNRLLVALNLGANPGTLRDLQIAFGQSETLLGVCPSCLGQIRTWRNLVRGQVNELPNFSTLL